MSNYYIRLGVDPTATRTEITAAYHRQRESYNPDRVEGLDTALQDLARQRSAELDQIYAVLTDPQRRRQYDLSIGVVPTGQSRSKQTSQRRGLSQRERLYVVAGVMAAVALIAAIWNLSGQSDSAQTAAMGTVDRPAPAIDLPALGGGEVHLNDYQGQVVLVNFWGTWCEPCRHELPALQSAYVQLHNRGFTVIGVSLADDEAVRGNSEEDIARFLEQYGVTYPIALDVAGEVTDAYRVLPLPTSFFIDPQGRIRYVRIGELTADDIIARFEVLKSDATVLHK